MEIALKQASGNDFGTKIINILSGFSEIQKTIYDAFENLSCDNPVNYIGELNKNDIMH